MSHKYNARATFYDGVWFPSQAEADRYKELKLAEAAGEIKYLLLHPKYILQDTFKDNTGKKQSAIHYIADFKYLETATANWVVEDVKGVETPVFKLKAKMFKKLYPNLELRIVR